MHKTSQTISMTATVTNVETWENQKRLHYLAITKMQTAVFT